MLIKVNSLNYNTKINIEIKPTVIKITYILILSIFLLLRKIIRENWTRKLIKKQVLVMDWHKNLVPPWNEIWASQSIPNPLISVGGGGEGRVIVNPSKLVPQWMWILLAIRKWLNHPHFVLPLLRQVAYVLQISFTKMARIWFRFPSLNGCFKTINVFLIFRIMWKAFQYFRS